MTDRRPTELELLLEELALEDELAPEVVAAYRLGAELLILATEEPALSLVAVGEDGFLGRRLRPEDGFALLVATLEEGEVDRATAWGGEGAIWRTETSVLWSVGRRSLGRKLPASVTLAVVRPPLALWLARVVSPGLRLAFRWTKGVGLVPRVETLDRGVVEAAAGSPVWSR